MDKAVLAAFQSGVREGRRQVTRHFAAALQDIQRDFPSCHSQFKKLTDISISLPDDNLYRASENELANELVNVLADLAGFFPLGLSIDDALSVIGRDEEIVTSEFLETVLRSNPQIFTENDGKWRALVRQSADNVVPIRTD